MCSLPAERKVHKIRPISKKGDVANVHNYRPISSMQYFQGALIDYFRQNFAISLPFVEQKQIRFHAKESLVDYSFIYLF